MYWENTNIWNTNKVTDLHYGIRKEYESKLCAFLKMGFIKNWDHLKETIEKLD